MGERVSEIVPVKPCRLADVFASPGKTQLGRQLPGKTEANASSRTCTCKTMQNNNPPPAWWLPPAVAGGVKMVNLFLCVGGAVTVNRS